MPTIGNRTSLYNIKGTNTTDYAKMKSHGYDCADFQGLLDVKGEYYKMSDEQLKIALAEEKKRAEDAGIVFSQVHGSWPVDDTTAEKRAQNLEYMKLCVRGTAYLGCKYVVVHPIMPYSWNDETDPDFAEKVNEDFFRELCAYAENYGVAVCIENMPTTKHRLAGIPGLVKFVKRLALPNFFICLDTGHCCVAHDDCGEMVRLCGGLLKTFHIHDNSGFHDEHMMPYCGKINWNSFREAVRETGFSGCLSIESCLSNQMPPELYERQLETLAIMAKSFDY